MLKYSVLLVLKHRPMGPSATKRGVQQLRTCLLEVPAPGQYLLSHPLSGKAHVWNDILFCHAVKHTRTNVIKY